MEKNRTGGNSRHFLSCTFTKALSKTVILHKWLKCLMLSVLYKSTVNFSKHTHPEREGKQIQKIQKKNNPKTKKKQKDSQLQHLIHFTNAIKWIHHTFPTMIISSLWFSHNLLMQWALNVQEEMIPDLLKFPFYIFHSSYYVFKGSSFYHIFNPFSEFWCFCVAGIMTPVSINLTCAFVTPCGKSIYHQEDVTEGSLVRAALSILQVSPALPSKRKEYF